MKFPKLPKRLKNDDRPYLPRRHRRTITLDRVEAADLRRYDPRVFCDDCGHYSARDGVCTLGYRAQHTRAEQMAIYELSGKIAYCRAMEID